MAFKDYYKILEIQPLASLPEVKKAYRQLARRFHPDINPNDSKATEYFQEIQIAYEVLSNPLKRQLYDKELKVKGQYSTFSKDNILHTEQIVKQTLDLYLYIKTQERRAINNDALTDFVLGLLNKDTMALLLRANNKDHNENVTTHLLYACKSIVAPRLFAQIAEQLLLLHPEPTNHFHTLIKEELESRVQLERQNRRVPLAALLIVLLIILLMCIILFS